MCLICLTWFLDIGWLDPRFASVYKYDERLFKKLFLGAWWSFLETFSDDLQPDGSCFNTACIFNLHTSLHTEALQEYWHSVKDTTWYRNHPILSSPDAWIISFSGWSCARWNDIWCSGIFVWPRIVTLRNVFRLLFTEMMLTRTGDDPSWSWLLDPCWWVGTCLTQNLCVMCWTTAKQCHLQWQRWILGWLRH